MLVARLSRLLGRRDGAPADGASAGSASPPPQDPLLEEVADLVRKSARGQVRLAAKLESIEAGLQAGFAERRAAVRGIATPMPEPLAGWGDVLDALDTLEHVASSVGPAADPAYAEGLRAVAARLERALTRVNIERVGEEGGPVDAKVLRVVGTEDDPDLPEGVVTRVVRAAAIAQGRVIREGEVFVNRRGNTA